MKTAHRHTYPSPTEFEPAAKRSRQREKTQARRHRRTLSLARGRAAAHSEHEHQPTGVHPLIPIAVLGVAVWFIAATSLTFTWDRESGYMIAVVITFTVFSLALILRIAAFSVADPRWQTRHVTLLRYLRGRTSIATGSIRGRDATTQILILPVSIALGMTAIGLVWALMH